MDYQVTYRELAAAPRSGRSLTVCGDFGTVADADLSGFRYDEIRFESFSGGLKSLLPAFLRRTVGESIPRFTNCRFDGMHCRWLHLGIARFYGCSWRDVDVKVDSPIHAHFVDCTLSGYWDGVFTARAGAGDSARKIQFRGNDLRELSGADFRGGIDVGTNKFLRNDGTQLLVTSAHPALAQAIIVATSDAPTHLRLESLLGRGPLRLDQDWLLLEEAETEPNVWGALQGLLES